MGTFSAFYVLSKGDATVATVQELFSHDDVKAGQKFIGVTLEMDDYGSPPYNLAGLSAQLETDVIWLAFQSVVDAFQFRHWQSGVVKRALVYGCHGAGEPSWDIVEGTAETWEQQSVFNEGALGHLLEDVESEQEKAEFQRIWRERELLPGRSIPFIYAREARRIAEFYGFPGWD